jgi:hypothetical protein
LSTRYRWDANRSAKQHDAPRVLNLFSCQHCSLAPINKKVSTMARPSNVNDGLTQTVGRKSKSLIIYGRHSRSKRLSRAYDLPSSPQKKLQPSRSWTSTSKGRSTRQIENTLTPPNSTKQLAVKSSPASSPAPKPLRDSIAHASTVQPAHVPALQPRTASNRSPAKSRSKLPPEPTTRRGNTRKSAAVETPNQLNSRLQIPTNSPRE